MASEADSPETTSARLGGVWQRLRNEPLIPLVIGVALAVTLLMGVVFWSGEPDYAVLYSDLSERDAGEIVTQLDQMQVAYKIGANGATLKVPVDVVDKTRLSIAGQGLPKGGSVGYELMDTQAFGISQFAEHVNYNRALEGELARSIASIDTVARARVHLAIPESSVFVRDKKQPTASVVLSLYNGRRLSEGQTHAIRHLVASSVSDLPADAVTVVDENGALLSSEDTGPGLASNARRLDYVGAIEQRYQRRVQELLAPLVGADNVRVQVAASVDFSTGEHTQETYTPNENTDEATIRSTQRRISRRNGRDNGGVPGALSNRPDPEATSPINDPANPPGAGANDREGGFGNQLVNSPAYSLDMPESVEQSSTINYEVNRRIEHVQRESGRIQRLSIAVVLNSLAAVMPVADTGQSGDPETASESATISDARLADIQRLVRGAMGYTEARGDQLEIMRAPFSDTRADVVAPTQPWWQNRQVLNLAQRLFKYLIAAIGIWFVWRRVIRPLLDRGLSGLNTRPATRPTLAAAGAEGNDAANAADAETRLRQHRMAEQRALLDNARDAARDDPRMVAMIVKGWMNERG